MAFALTNIDSFDRRHCRRHVEDHFSTPHMANHHTALYQHLLAHRPAHPT